MSDEPLTESTPAIPPDPPVRYATFTGRFRALLIDNLCISGLCIALFFAAEPVSDLAGATRVMLLLVVAVILLYEPLQVSRRGATIGHRYAHLRVVDARTGSWPSFGRAFVRFLIKTILGVISFFTMELSRRHQAVHELLTHTTVQVVASEEVVDYRVERVDEPDVKRPGRLRRLAVILLYLVAIFFVYAISISIIDTAGCLRHRSGCSAVTRALVPVMGWAWIALSVTAIIAGWKGLLLGARRSRGVSSGVLVA
jgi:uncharacterized RDD family membrane protein YckC